MKPNLLIDIFFKSLFNFTATKDCQVIQAFQGRLCFLTPEDLQGLDAQVVVDCIAEFQDCSWDPDSLDSLKEKYQQVNKH